MIEYPKNLEELRNSDPEKIALLPRYDSRDFNIVKKYVETQQGYNLCWAFTTAAASEVSILREGINSNFVYGTNEYDEVPAGKTVIDINEMNIDYVTNVRTRKADLLGLNQENLFNYQLNTGNRPQWAANALMQWNGVGNQSLNEQTFEGGLRYFDDGPFVLESYELVPNNDELIKKAIAKYGAVGFTYMVPLREEFSYLLASKYGGSHTSTIVGWDDNIDKNLFMDYGSGKKPTKNGGWIVRNSWGSSAHDNGYFYMSYESMFKDVIAFDYGKRSDYENNYYWDGMVNKTEYYIYETKNKEVSAVFPVLKASYNKKEYLKAFNISFTGEDVTLDLKVYSNLSNQNDPESGRLVYNSIKQYENPGAYTITLDNPIELKNGENFAIVAKATNPTDDALISMNSDKSHNDLTFYKSDKNKWINLLSMGQYVAKIKAFTVTRNIQGSHNNNLKYATVTLNKASIRYGENENTIKPVVMLGGQKLIENIDYSIRYEKVLNKPAAGTSSDDEKIGDGICVIEGKNEYSGINKTARFSIIVGIIPPLLPDIVQFNESSGKWILKVSQEGITRYNQIIVQNNWYWTFPDQQITYGKEDDNYIQYKADDDWCYRRSMLGVTPIKN